uniref:Bidirectional sugar transporter SWEET n=1 Tax=Oryza punctata TaxID=4537 RepID=A0A0E0JHQ9_ORYPU
MDYSTLFIIGIMGNIAAGLVFLSPIKTFCRIVRRGTTEGFGSAPYVFTLLNALLWFYYGVTKPDGLLVATINGFGAVVELAYVALFIGYAADQATRLNTIKWAVVLDIGFTGLVFVVTRFAISELNLRIMVIGIVCACFNIFMYGAPLAAVRTVITEGSVEFMPLFLSMSLLINGGIWVAYAMLDRDIFLLIPNGIGFILGTIQLIVYYFHPSLIYYFNMIFVNRLVPRNGSEAAAGEPQEEAPLLAPNDRHGQDV